MIRIVHSNGMIERTSTLFVDQPHKGALIFKNKKGNVYIYRGFIHNGIPYRTNDTYSSLVCTDGWSQCTVFCGYGKPNKNNYSWYNIWI